MNLRSKYFVNQNLKFFYFYFCFHYREAEATRNALHGVHWPIGNGKKLIIDYATLEDLQKTKNPTPTPATPTEKLPEKENRVR